MARSQVSNRIVETLNCLYKSSAVFGGQEFQSQAARIKAMLYKSGLQHLVALVGVMVAAPIMAFSGRANAQQYSAGAVQKSPQDVHRVETR